MKMTWEEVISRLKEMGLYPDKVYDVICNFDDMAKMFLAIN
ncbi:MAG: hypothetical protein ACQEWF_01625 [Bacillota bacterium]